VINIKPDKTISPFSSLCNYSIIYGAPVEPMAANLTDREKVAVEILENCGVAAGFQLESLWPPKKGGRALKRLARFGVVWRHRLEGEYTLNIYTMPGSQPSADECIRRMAIAELYRKAREVKPASIKPAEPPLAGILELGGAEFPLLVVRRGDGTRLLPQLLKNLPRLLVVAELSVPFSSGAQRIEQVFFQFPFLRECGMRIPLRVTTDERLMELPFSSLFFGSATDNTSDNASSPVL